ncbi:hypothetical protein [uncultured Neglectibacter sp.]|uniref:hypothetical protein n=1 Tax=uncultured Neglectibacter sp. TaxID=1924108 RepID=UPI0034E056CF
MSDLKNSMKVALCGVLAALSTAVMFLTGLIPVATLALPAIAGCFLIPVVGEIGVPWGFGVYAVCGALSFLLAPDREAALCYLLFFGYYPALTAVLGRIRNRTLRVVVKLLIFNAAVVLETLLSIYVLHIPWESIGALGKATPFVLLALANLMFVLYDRALDGLIILYFRKFSRQVRRVLKLK